MMEDGGISPPSTNENLLDDNRNNDEIVNVEIVSGDSLSSISDEETVINTVRKSSKCQYYENIQVYKKIKFCQL